MVPRYYTKIQLAGGLMHICLQGLFLEGARWDGDLMLVAESIPRILFDTMPVVSFGHR